MITDLTKVNLVSLTYGVAVRDKFLNKYQPMIRPIEDRESKSFQNSVSFYNMAELQEKSIYDMIRIGLDLFSEEWCTETFKKPYVPFPILIGENSRSRILKQLPRKSAPNNPRLAVDRIMNVLGCFPKSVAFELIKSGVLVGGDSETQELVLERLSKKERRKRDRL